MTDALVSCPFFQPEGAHFCAVVSSQPGHPKPVNGAGGHPPQCQSGSYICCPLFEHVQRRLEAVHRRRQRWSPHEQPFLELAS